MQCYKNLFPLSHTFKTRNYEAIGGQLKGKMEVEARFHWFEIKLLEIINVDSPFEKCSLRGRRGVKWPPSQRHKFEKECFGVNIFLRWRDSRMLIYYWKGQGRDIKWRNNM